MADPNDQGVVLTDEQKRRQRGRSIAIALVLGGLVVCFYIVTFYKFGGGPG